jgi:hypothetical protein
MTRSKPESAVIGAQAWDRNFICSVFVPVDPLVDDRGERMHWVGRLSPQVA